MWKQYKEIRGHVHDFEVEYSIFKDTTQKFYQGIRCDFCYDEYQKNSDGKYLLYIIWPEFLDANGQVILERGIEVNLRGKAYMWILFPENRPFHMERIKIGIKGYFMCGSRKLGEVIVTKIVGLPTNPRC